jgi:hypothetical protein
MTRRCIFILAALLIIIWGCSDEHGSSPTAFSYEALPAPQNLQLAPGDWEITLSWEYPPEKEPMVENYLVYRYYFTEYGEYIEIADTTDSKEYTDSDLIGNVEYCYMVSAVDSNGMEGRRTGIECEYAETP